MKKYILIILIFLLAYNFIIAQEKSTFKRFNYGADASLIAYPINVFENVKKTTNIYGIHPKVYFNFNKYLFLQTGIGLENGKYDNIETFTLNGQLENSQITQKYVRASVPFLFGYRSKDIFNKTKIVTSIGLRYDAIIHYYTYIYVSSTPYIYENTGNNIVKALIAGNISFSLSLGIERSLNKHSIGLSMFMIRINYQQTMGNGWYQSNMCSNLQSGIKLTYFFNNN